MLQNRPQTQRREERQRADDHDNARQQHRKQRLSTGNVPSDGGAIFLVTRFPATASIGTIIRKRPASMDMPGVTVYQCVFALIPANAEPLFPVADVYAYKIRDSPCGPWFDMLDSPAGSRADIAANPG